MTTTATTPFGLQLNRSALFTLADAAGVPITCQEGTVWITLDNDPRDIVLEASERFVTPEHRRAIVYALRPPRLTVGAAPATTPLQAVPTRMPWGTAHAAA